MTTRDQLLSMWQEGYQGALSDLLAQWELGGPQAVLGTIKNNVKNPVRQEQAKLLLAAAEEEEQSLRESRDAKNLALGHLKEESAKLKEENALLKDENAMLRSVTTADEEAAIVVQVRLSCAGVEVTVDKEGN